MRKLLLAGIAAVGIAISAPAYAIDVECINCSQWAEQLLSDAKQAASYATQLQQKVIQGEQLANQIQNTVSLPLQIYSQVQNDINQVRNLANAASILTGNSGTIMSRLSNASYYANSAASLPADIGNQFTMWNQTIANANNSLGRTVATQQQQMMQYAAMQDRIQLQSQTADGALKAIQAGNQFAALQATQMNQLQTTLTAAAQAQAARDLVAHDQQAGQQQAMLNFFKENQTFNTTGGVQY